ncbi:MAG: hypothetical protein U0694_28340 [Anaerolineae bacterium]
METNTLLLIGAGILGALFAILLLIKIIKGILQIAYLLVVLAASGFVAYYLGTPEGSKFLPQTVDVRLIQAGVVIVLPLVLSLFITVLMFMLRSVFKSGPKQRAVSANQTPVAPFHPPSQEELDQMRRTNPMPPPQYPPTAPTIQNLPAAPPTRPNPTRRNRDDS